jgi:hypothetical protein
MKPHRRKKLGSILFHRTRAKRGRWAHALCVEAEH